MTSYRNWWSTIFAALIVLGIISASALAIVRNNEARKIEEAFDRLQLFHELRKTALEDLINSMRTEIKVASESTRIKQALADFGSAWFELGDDAADTLKRLYIRENPFEADERYKLEIATDGSRYSLYHREFHRWARQLLKHFGYYDVFLVDAKGNIIYTSAKEDDLATNLLDGPFSNSNLGKTVRSAMQRPGVVAFSDFELYAPSNNEPALFAGSAIRNDRDELLGVVAVQLPRESIQRLLNFSEGMGATGETYVVGPDALMRSQSRFTSQSTILKQKVDTLAVREGLKGRTGAKRITDYRGVPVLSVWSPFDLDGKRWVLIAEIDEQEVLSDANWEVYDSWRWIGVR